MFTTALIAFREFLEAFLIVGVFWGLSKSLSLKKEKEIVLAAGIGIAISFVLSIGTFAFGDSARVVLTEESAELLGSYLMIFSGCFLAYVIFSLHKVLHVQKMSTIKNATEKLKKKVFDVSLFFTILFLVVREGFEVALFTASTSLFSVFFQNMMGLFAGFVSAGAVGLATSMAYLKFSVKRVFQVTEYMIILLGAAMVQNGITELFEIYWHVELDEIIPLAMPFLPDSHNAFGNALQTFTGIDQHFSGARLAIMIGYVGMVYLLFLRRENPSFLRKQESSKTKKHI
jgi:FTR1 family protein